MIMVISIWHMSAWLWLCFCMCTLCSHEEWIIFYSFCLLGLIQFLLARNMIERAVRLCCNDVWCMFGTF